MTDPATISVSAELSYELNSPASFAFAVAAARTGRQTIVDETITVEPNVDYSLDAYGEAASHQLIRFDAQPGPLHLSYRATAEVTPRVDDQGDLGEMPFGEVPADVLPFLNPSRYCESDVLMGLATRLFGNNRRGYGRVQDINDWVRATLSYIPGVTNASSSTTDVLVEGAGVCRDYAHVAISLCRALGIPARYVAGYGVGVEPQDFHGFFEAYLNGDWWLFDPTGMAAVDHLVRIGYGRDAADASFATFVGQAMLTAKTIVVEVVDAGHGNGAGAPADSKGEQSGAATSTA